MTNQTLCMTCKRPCHPGSCYGAGSHEFKPAPGWLQRQLDNVDAEVAKWPESMKRAAGLESEGERMAESKDDLTGTADDALSAGFVDAVKTRLEPPATTDKATSLREVVNETPKTFQEWQLANKRLVWCGISPTIATDNYARAAWDAGARSRDEEVRQAQAQSAKNHDAALGFQNRALNAESHLASVTDLLNSWARESEGVAESLNESGAKALVDRLWSHWSSKHHAQQEQIRVLVEAVVMRARV